MSTVICTLFEGHYHYGVASLTSSLYKQGFRGSIFAGYRGQLPAWAKTNKKNSGTWWEGGETHEVAGGLQLHFLPLETSAHLTNYKPDFMLDLLNGPAKGAQAIYYFDPDVMVTANWPFFETWTTSGVALCEDVNSPLAAYHPRRTAWRRYFEKKGIKLSFKDSIYANGGFIGLKKNDFDFLNQWQHIQQLMAPEIGGLHISVFSGKPLPEGQQENFNPFSRTDQDALNATVEAWKGDISFLGKEAMGFGPGISVLPHALGSYKPWQKGLLKRCLMGYPPRLADREYWQSVNSLIVTHGKIKTLRYRAIIQITAFIGRFYSRLAI
jgi:hypothetical protein